MPTDACQFFYECGTCKALLRPKTGRLLRFLLLRLREMSARSGAEEVLLKAARPRAQFLINAQTRLAILLTAHAFLC
jgi:hypothetical protein